MAEPDRLSQWIDAYLNGTASDAELNELGAVLERDAQAADRFWAAAELDSLLESQFAFEPARAAFEEQVDRLTKAAATRRRMAWAVAACVLLALGGTALWQFERGPFSGYDVVSGQVLVDGLQSGRIVAGAPVVVFGKLPAVIRLPDGSQAEFEPESEVVVRDGDGAADQIVELHTGSGSFHVPKGERGLRVETAVGNVTSADTQFSVDYLFAPEADDNVRVLSTGFAALIVSVAAGIVQVDVQDQHFTLSGGESRVFAAAPQDAQEKKGVLPFPPGDLLGFGINGKLLPLERTYPGIRSTLLLTDEQRRRIDIALKATVQSETVRAAGMSIKTTPEAKLAEKLKAKELVAAAKKQLHENMAAILTAEQKTLVQKLNAAAAEAQTAVHESLRDDLKSAKFDKTKAEAIQQRMREPLIKEFRARAAKFLTPEQTAAMQRESTEQQAAEERAKHTPKPLKGKKPY